MSCRHRHQHKGSGRRQGREWVRAGWVTSLLVLFLCAAALAAARGTTALSTTALSTTGVEPASPFAIEPVRVPSGPGVHLNPTIAVDRHGYATVAWVQRLLAGDEATPVEIRLAQAPEWTPVTVAVTFPERAASLRPLLVTDEATHLVWSEPSATTVTVWQYTHGLGEAPEAWSEVVPHGAVLAPNPDGSLQALWAQDDGLVLIDGATRDEATLAAPHSALTSSLTLDLTVSPTELDLAVDALGRSHVVWAGWRAIDQDASIHYAAMSTVAALDADASPIQVDVSGRSPRLAVGPSGTVHLCWRRAEGLYCADSRDWGSVHAVAPDLADERVALAVGPNDVAHVAWSSDGALWYANSGDWAASRRLAALDATQLGMAVDSAGRPHLVATVETEEGNSALYVLCPFSPEPQLAIAAPTAGEWLARGDPLIAVANLPAAEWQRVTFYLRPEAALGTALEDALIPIGTDHDGRDGWSVPFEAEFLDTSVPHRVVAVGVGMRGGVTLAVGDPMTVLPSGRCAQHDAECGDASVASFRDVWVLNPGPEVVQGMGHVWVMTPGAGANLARLEVLLITPGCHAEYDAPSQPQSGETELATASVCSIPPRAYLVASLDVNPSHVRPDREWLPVTYDSRTLPDGAYRISVVAIDRDGREHVGIAAEMLTIDNHLAPSVRITEPRPGATLRGTFRVAAEARGGAAPVQRVDFYAERQRTLLQQSQGGLRHTVQAPDVVWLGSDSDGSDGWGVRVTANQRLDGDAWVLRAMAYDARGRSVVARSQVSFTIVGRERPVPRFVFPMPGSEVAGIVPVIVQAVMGSRHIAAIDLYAETPGERLIPLGAMEERAGQWMRDWNTADLPDGDYDLVVVTRHADGRSSMVRGGEMGVRNVRGEFRFAEPEAAAVLRGAPVLRLLGVGRASEVWVYYRDAEGALRPIGAATPGDRETAASPAGPEAWTLVWDTSGVLDGTYDLVAAARDAGGGIRYAEQRVTVNNGSAPSLVTWPAEGDVVSGTLHIAWQVEGAARVTLDWSPDGGVHWIGLANDLGADGRFEWDTAQALDTPRAMLRLSIGDGGRRAVVRSGPFTINNVNEAPRVALLAPGPQEAHGSPVFVAWQAWDPDGDPLTVALDYRRGLGAWQPLARGLSGTRSFSWDTSDLAPAADYMLRVTVRDPAGARAADEVADLSLLVNRPPEVRLVTPNERSVLHGDAVILWQAEDPDDDPLLIDLYYSDDAGQTWLPLTEGIANTGYYMWQVSFLPLDSHYRLRVVARDGVHWASDDSDGTFVVGGPPPPTLLPLHPVAGDHLAGVVPVRWDSGVAASAGLTATVSVRSGEDTRWHLLVEDAPDDGLFAWDTTALPDGAYELRVTLSDGRDEASIVMPVTVANQRNERPEVVLLAPAGGETWRGTREIVWRAWDNDGDPLLATVSVSADGGANWQELATVDAGQGRYVWDTGALRGVHSLLARVVVSDDQTSAQAVTPAPFSVANGVSGPTVRFLSPDGDGTLWRKHIVMWEVGSMGGAPPRIWLALRRDDAMGHIAAALTGAIPWQPIIEASYDAGEAVVPTEWLKPGRSYRLRLIADDGAFRVSGFSAPFEVVMAGSEPPTVTLEQPTGGETWSGEQEIRWQARTSDGRALRVTLELSRDGGATWFDLARDQPSAGQHMWDTTTVANGVYRLRLTVGDDRAESVVVSGPFVVENPGRNAPVLSLISPRAGETWSGTREILWRIAEPSRGTLTVTLAYSLDGGGTWRRFAVEYTSFRNVPASDGQAEGLARSSDRRDAAIAQPEAGTGSPIAGTGRAGFQGYLWDTTTVPNCDAVWLRATVSDGALVAEDYAGPFVVRNTRGPVVALLEPRGGEQWSGQQRIVWHTAYEAGRTVKKMLQFSVDRGRTWQTIAHDLPMQGSYRWDTTMVADYADVLLRAYVSDGQQSAMGMTRAPLRVRNLSPRAELPFYLP